MKQQAANVRWLWALVGALVIATSTTAVWAKAAKKPTKQAPGETPAAEAPAAEEPPARFKPLFGPKRVDLGHELEIGLPEGFLLFEKADAKTILSEMGNTPDDSLLALVTKSDADWFVEVAYVEDGYVKDDDAAELDADEILGSIREGTEEANKDRVARGFSPLKVDGWTEPPRYEKAVHQLVWGVKGTSQHGSSVNFNTRVLGRRGWVSLNLIAAADKVDAFKPEVKTLLAATTFKQGSRYEDFDSSKDKVAEYGLAALVAGGAGAVALKLAKAGLLAKFGGKLVALLLAAKKLIVPLIVFLAAGIRQLFSWRKRKAEAARQKPPTDAPPAANVG